MMIDEASTAWRICGSLISSSFAPKRPPLAERLEAEETIEGPDLEAVLALVRPEVTLFGGIVPEPQP